ncbi:MAG: RNA-binding protein [bacterium]|nr:MAG: RNA-binding protein [bacterium]
MKIYVGNMSYDTSEDDLRKAFEAHGQVDSITIITDRDTGRPKGFGFVEMSNDTEARAAMDNLNEKDFMGRSIKVNEARPRTEGRRGGNRGGYNSRY